MTKLEDNMYCIEVRANKPLQLLGRSFVPGQWLRFSKDKIEKKNIAEQDLAWLLHDIEEFCNTLPKYNPTFKGLELEYRIVAVEQNSRVDDANTVRVEYISSKRYG